MSENLWLLSPTAKATLDTNWMLITSIPAGRQQDKIVLDTDPEWLLFADSEEELRRQLASKVAMEEDAGGIKLRKAFVGDVSGRLAIRLAGERAGQVDVVETAKLPDGLERLSDLIQSGYSLCPVTSSSGWPLATRLAFHKVGLIEEYLYRDRSEHSPSNYGLLYDQERARFERRRYQQLARQQKNKSLGQMKKKFPVPTTANSPIQGYKVHRLVGQLKDVLEKLGFWATARQITGGTNYSRAETVAVEMVRILLRLIGEKQVKQLPGLVWLRWAEWVNNPEKNATRLPKLAELFETLSPARYMKQATVSMSACRGSKAIEQQLNPIYDPHVVMRIGSELPSDKRRPLETRLRLNLRQPAVAIDVWIGLRKFESCHVAVTKNGAHGAWVFLPIGPGRASKNPKDLYLPAVGHYGELTYVGIVTRAQLRRMVLAEKLEEAKKAKS